MTMINPFFKERDTKSSSQGKSLGKISMTRNEDKKPNIEIISKMIKKEPDFVVREIKKEPNFMVREIKKEPNFMVSEIKKEPNFIFSEIKRESYDSDTKVVTAPKSRKNKPRVINKRKNTKKKKFSQKKTETENCEGSSTSRKPAKRRKRKSARKRNKKNRKLGSTNNIRKQANTLLDYQNNGSLRLFGFKDQLEYFSLESDHEEFKQTSSERDVIGKRTSLSSLSARKKLIRSLKSASVNPISKPKSIIQPPVGENVDILGSILESQSLWHSKNFDMKVNEDGKVEVINQKENLRKIPSDKKRKTNSITLMQASNDSKCTLLNSIRGVPCESLNLNENTETHLRIEKIKVEPWDTEEASDVEIIFEDIKKEPCIEKIKIELKDEKRDLSKSPPPISSSQEYTSIISESAFVRAPNVEKSDDECDDCPIFSTYSKASKVFSSERDKKREGKFLVDQSEIQYIKTEIKGNTLKRHKDYQEIEIDREIKRKRKMSRSPSPKRIKQENQR